MSQVAFRRIGGHVVPIREGGSHTNEVKTIAAGAAVSVAAGTLAGTLDTRAAYAKAASHNVKAAAKVAGKFGVKSIAFKESSMHRLESIRSHKAATRIKAVGAATGAALIGAGVSKALEKTDLDSSTKSTVTTASTVAAYFGVRSAHSKVFGRTKTWAAIKHAAGRVLVRGIKL